MSSDLRLVHLVGDGNRAIRGDGTDATRGRDALTGHLHDVRAGSTATRAIDATTDNPPPPIIPLSTIPSTVADRPTTPTQPETGQPVARPVEQAPKDDFAKANPPAWERFMDDMTSALDIALAVEEAAKDGNVDANEWADVFAKANKDGQVSLLEISGMYAGLQDMHDKGILDDGEYQDAVHSLDAELTARYNGGAGEGLDILAQLYLERLGGGDRVGENGQGEADTQVTGRDDAQGHEGHRLDRVDGHERVEHDDHEDRAEDVTQTGHGLRQQVNDDREDGAISQTRQAERRHDINAGIATALTDIGINRRVGEVTAGRRGEGRRGDL